VCAGFTCDLHRFKPPPPPPPPSKAHRLLPRGPSAFLESTPWPVQTIVR
jgi:hypothetical protein